ncbi:hypothetical protein QCM77_05745 [Bradyrhizobium sp. SSUT18]|uniref:hypothetical protein n=1 Tax=Bradyrhizobium sp. SSUT18 TaxID=3040602 RepID=UPI002446A1DF|nr:hypothetical protein [Bradyrhizobium sp. SSUT18]MDH2399451.1 hypothetical protein [Bradyrhizobium sp. SSUT18]
MRLIARRKYSFIDAETLIERQALDTLFRFGEQSFLLHITPGEGDHDQIVWLDCREALLWINQSTDDFGTNFRAAE